MTDTMDIPLTITNNSSVPLQSWPFTRGVPITKGTLDDIQDLRLSNPSGKSVPAQYRILSRWPDNSIKWVLTDFQADVPAGDSLVYRLGIDKQHVSPNLESIITTKETNEQIIVDTGPMQCCFSKNRFSLFEQVKLRNDGTDQSVYTVYNTENHNLQGDTWVRISEGSLDGSTQRRIYGMGGVCRASLAQDAYTITIEEAGPLRTVIRCDGAFEADIPMHHYAGYQPFRLTTRIYAYAGHCFLRVLHTVVVACNPRETEIDEIALHIPVSLNSPAHYTLSGLRIMEGELLSNEMIHLAQREDNHFQIFHQEGKSQRKTVEGEQTEGWITVDDDRIGLGVGLRYMAEEYPKALEANTDGITAYFWRDPDGKRLNLGRYAEEIAWHEGEGVYSDGTGVAKTSELFIHFYDTPSRHKAIRGLQCLLKPPHIAIDPAWAARCEVTGGFSAYNPDRFPASERMMSGFVDWMARSIKLGRWYGFLDWGDVLAAWDEVDEDWRFRGRWGWCNSEWDPRHGVWIQYLRTGDPKYYHLGEAMTRHSMDVDTCHYHPFRPYMVGGCFRHSIDHFSDEPCASHTFIDNWVDYYYLTGDLRTFDVLKETGAFLMRYRWSEDPAYSFSLRSIANILRGLLYVYEVTGESRYMDQALAVYDIIARGQNEDGSWHKRFQVSTPDKLPDQAPYGMATEGTTLAVEMGTAAPFTDDEFRAIGGRFAELIRVLPVEEQKGYQTHYLLIGVELLHRITGRKDVADVYRRAVDWFCGYPAEFNTDFALKEHYSGILCRHVAYAYKLTGDQRYLHIGRSILHQLMDIQDWRKDPKYHGAIGMSPTYLSLLFFGVPYFLGILNEADLEET